MEKDKFVKIEFDDKTVDAETSWVPNEVDNSINAQEQKLTVRLDKWLWAARFFKTRALARAAVEKGKILYNGQATKASREIALGDKVRIKQGHTNKELVIIGLSTRRRNSVDAQTLFKEVESTSYQGFSSRTASATRNTYSRTSATGMHAATPFMPKSNPTSSRRIEVRGKSNTSVRFLRRQSGKTSEMSTNSCFLLANDDF